MKKKQHIYISFFVVIVFLSGIQICSGDESQLTRALAYTLSAEEGNHSAAAIEYRRLGMMTEDQENRAGYYLAAAFEYLITKDFNLSLKMLDKAESGFDGLREEMLLLRAEAAMSGKEKVHLPISL